MSKLLELLCTLDTTSVDANVMVAVTHLIKAQADAMAAQAKATVVQYLPSLPRFTREGEDAVDDHCDKWGEQFKLVGDQKTSCTI